MSTSEVLEGKKIIMIYFSAHWCPPCRGFTPQLAAKYKATAAEQQIEVVFVSSDRDQASFMEYYGTMPWLAIPQGDKRKAKKIICMRDAARWMFTLQKLQSLSGIAIRKNENQLSKSRFLQREHCILMENK